MRRARLSHRTRVTVTWTAAFLMAINSASSLGLACQSWYCNGTCMNYCQSVSPTCGGTVVSSWCEPACGTASSCSYATVVIYECGVVGICGDVCITDDACGGSTMCGSPVMTLESPAERSTTIPTPSASDRATTAPLPAEEAQPFAPVEAPSLPPSSGADAIDDVMRAVAPEPPVPSTDRSDALPTGAAETEPIETPAPAMDRSGLFDELPEAAPTAEQPPPPAESGRGDLFDELPATEPAEPAAAATEDDSFGDLFEEMPAETPAGEFAPAPDDSGIEDLFDESPAETAEDTSATDNGVPELEPAAPPASDEPAAEEPAAEEPATDEEDSDSMGDLEDLFGGVFRSTSQPMIAARQFPVRVWTDNTGKFTTVARLVELGDGYVRLHKENGRRCTVRHRRLSADDFDYVQTLAVELGLPAMGRLAER